MRALTTDEMSNRLNQYVAAPAAQAQLDNATATIRRNELAGNFRDRVLIPGFRCFLGFFGRWMPSRSIESIEHQLMIANHPFGLGAREFFGIRIVCAVLGTWLAIVILRREISILSVVTAVIALYVAVFLPRTWLRGKVRRRQNSIRKGLPDALDMLSVCADAGLGFDQSLLRVSQHWKTPVGVEFGRVVAEMEMGVPRAQALRNMANRLDVIELSSFVGVIIQSDQLGMSIADTLHSQAQQMRVERRFRAQEQARKVPLKMLFPMILLIFPAMLAVVCGPVIPILVEFFASLRGNI
jgi:tight adherence protein C